VATRLDLLFVFEFWIDFKTSSLRKSLFFSPRFYYEFFRLDLSYSDLKCAVSMFINFATDESLEVALFS